MTEGKLVRSIEFDSFKQAMDFMAQVAVEAERLGHHPDWSNSHTRVGISLSTHDAGGRITEKDHALASAIDRVLARPAG